jgi:hypothetical protein
MPSNNQIFQGAAGGAAIGGSFLGPWGAAGGAVIGGLGTALFGGDSPEQQREKRKADYLKVLAGLRQKELVDATAAISKQTTGQMSNVRQAAARRFASMGRTDAEAAINPAVSGVADIGSRTLENTTQGINRSFDQAQIDAEAGYANRPIEPSLTDTLLELGNASLNFKGTQDRAKAMALANGTEPPATSDQSPTDILNNANGIGSPVTVKPYQMPATGSTNIYDTLAPLRKLRNNTQMVDMYRSAYGR